MRPLGEILAAVKSGGACTEDELRCAVVALDGLETLTGFALRKDKSANLARYERLKRVLDIPPDEWLGDRNPLLPEAQKLYRRSAEAVGTWFDREER